VGQWDRVSKGRGGHHENVVERESNKLLIDCCSITPVQSRRDLGIYIDCDASQRFVSYSKIRRSVGHISAEASGRLDYRNGVLVGLPSHLTRRRQSVLNAEAGLIRRLRTRDHCSHQSALVVGFGTNSVQAG